MFFWVDRNRLASIEGRDHGPWYIRAMAGCFAFYGIWSWGCLCWAVIVRKTPIGPNAAIFAQVFLMTLAYFLVACLLWFRSRFAALLTLLIPPAQMYGYMRLHPEQPGFLEYEPHIVYFAHLPHRVIGMLIIQSGLAAAAVILWKRRLLH